MIKETGRIVAVEKDSVWVETIQKSTCGSCAAEKGCGQSMLAKWGGHTAYLRVLLQGRDPDRYSVNDYVQIGITEDVLAKGALFTYMVPLLCLLMGAWAGHHWFDTEVASVLGGVLSLLAGGGIVRLQAYHSRNDERLQPVLIDDEQPIALIS